LGILFIFFCWGFVRFRLSLFFIFVFACTFAIFLLWFRIFFLLIILIFILSWESCIYDCIFVVQLLKRLFF
jgi:hypothetical protein